MHSLLPAPYNLTNSLNLLNLLQTIMLNLKAIRAGESVSSYLEIIVESASLSALNLLKSAVLFENVWKQIGNCDTVFSYVRYYLR